MNEPVGYLLVGLACLTVGCSNSSPSLGSVVYQCDAEPPDSAGCPATPLDPDAATNHNLYPLGCVVMLPATQPNCTNSLCAPNWCPCQEIPADPDHDAGQLRFLCPL